MGAANRGGEVRRESVREAAVPRAIGVEPVGGEELLTARAEHLVDRSAGADVGRARGLVGGSTLAALVRGAPQAEHRFQGSRDPRHDREVDQATDDGLDPGPVQRSDDRTEVPLELHERGRVDRVVRADRHDRDLRACVEDCGKLVHQHIGDAGSTHREAREVHAVAQAGGSLRHEDVPRRFESGPGERAVPDHRDPWGRASAHPVTTAAVVPGQVLIVELRQGRVGGALRLHP